jgi:hypothetical protein
MVLTIWNAALIMFFAIPIIALFDWIMFSARVKQDIIEAVKEYNTTGDVKIGYMAWLPACVMESLFFITGIVIGYLIR